MKKVLFIVLSTIYAFSVKAQFNLNHLSNLTYPGQELSSCWGYTAPNGTEYALVGTSTKLSIVSLADPANPVEVAAIPGPNTIWREMKVWGNYCYLGMDNVNVGIQIVDLSQLPNAAPFITWSPTFNSMGVNGQLRSCHTVTIDEFGYMYLNGTNLNNGAPLIFDVHTTPGTPILIGVAGNTYCHDSFCRDNILWCADVYAGYFEAWDVSNHAAPVSLGLHTTPSNFTHNCWLSDDSQTLFTTDEVAEAFVTAYDVNDLNNIQEIDRYFSPENYGQGIIPHNVHVLNDYIVTAYYTEGVKVLDAHIPDNLVEVGSYDTYLGTNWGFDGVWGVYPYFASGVMIASDISTGLHVFRPTYNRACYLEGNVTDASNGNTVFGATITLNTTTISSTSNLQGAYATGYHQAGTYTATASKAGYFDQTVSVTLVNGQITVQNFQLVSMTSFAYGGVVKDAATNAGIGNAVVRFKNTNFDFTVQTNANGQFNVAAMYAGTYTVTAGHWGHKAKELSATAVGASNSLVIALDKGYRDEFALDLGWTVTSTATTGIWERAVSQQQDFNGVPSTPLGDVAGDIGGECYVTGNTASTSSDNDVDDGNTVLTSPAMTLNAMSDPYVSFNSWFFNAGGNTTPNDEMKVEYVPTTGTPTLLKTINVATPLWTSELIRLKDFVAVPTSGSIRFTTTDNPQGHIVESAIDVFMVFDSTAVNTQNINNNIVLNVYPNPTAEQFQLDYQFDANSATMTLFNIQGQKVETFFLNSSKGVLQFGQELSAGVYQLEIVLEKGERSSVKIVKI